MSGSLQRGSQYYSAVKLGSDPVPTFVWHWFYLFVFDLLSWNLLKIVLILQFCKISIGLGCKTGVFIWISESTNKWTDRGHIICYHAQYGPRTIMDLAEIPGTIYLGHQLWVYLTNDNDHSLGVFLRPQESRSITGMHSSLTLLLHSLDEHFWCPFPACMYDWVTFWAQKE